VSDGAQARPRPTRRNSRRGGTIRHWCQLSRTSFAGWFAAPCHLAQWGHCYSRKPKGDIAIRSGRL